MDIDQAAGLIVNPLTAIGLLDTARRRGHPAAVHTAAASQLGRMLLAMSRKMDYPLVHVVRREAQVELLKSLGAEKVLNSTDEDFPEQLHAVCERLGATAAFEAIGGEMTGTIINAMPVGSEVYVYGALCEEACDNIDPLGLIFRRKSVRGFYLGEWLQSRGMLGTLQAAGYAQRMLIDGTIQTKVRRRLSLRETVEGLQEYINQMTEGKMLIEPHKS